MFNRSQPQLAPCGDGLIMVWVEDDPSRDTYNRMRLVYSLYDAATEAWTKPQPVSDDGHNDAYPSLVSDGTNIYVAWQKINKTLTEADCTGVDVLLANSEIYLAKFDAAAGTFQAAQQLTDNDLYEYAPVVALSSKKPVVYYASVPGNQINQAGAHTLYRYKTKAEAMETELNYILTITALGNAISCSMDVDGDLSTTSDIGVFTVESFFSNFYFDEFTKKETDGGFVYAGYGKLDGKTTLFVSDMTNFYYVKGWERQAVLDSHRAISGNINIVETNTGTRIFWTETEETGSTLYTVCYENEAWTAPVKVSSLDRTLRDTEILTLNGQLLGVCNADTAQNTTDLVFFEVHDFTDLAVVDYIYFDETTVLPGREQSFDVLLRNQGTTTVTEVVFTVTDGLGTEHTVTQTLSLAAGVAQRVTLTYPVPENYSGTTLEITAAVSGTRDANPENNTATVGIGKPDLAVLEASVHTFDDGYILNIVIENNSLVDANNVTLDVMLDKETNAPLHTQTIGTLDRGTYASIQVGIPQDQLFFDESGIARVYLRAESDVADAAGADNLLCVLITKPMEGGCAHFTVETVPQKNPDCTQPGHTAYTKCLVCGEILEGNDPLSPLGHDYTMDETLPTCTEQGYATYSCEVCGESYRADFVDALGHAFGAWETVREPNYLENGLRERHCERCSAVESEEINNNPYPDVPNNSFKDYILWCSYEGIIIGDRQGNFNPTNTITRGQFILMLWRAAGKPEPTQYISFPDVTGGTYYKAVCWAVEKGITNGKNNGMFGVTDPCTRGHVALFLYRYAGQPEPTQYQSFPDVSGGTYYKAVCWLVEQGITNGQTDGKFGVNNACQRRHVAKFLFLYLTAAAHEKEIF